MHKTIFEHSNGLKSIHLSGTSNQEFAPLIILFPAFDGQSEFMLTYGHRIVDQGFQVVIADVFGDGAKFNNIEDCFTAATHLLNDRKLVRNRTIENIKAAIKFTSVDIENTGVMGFCLGGMCAIEAARSGLKAPAYFCAHGNLESDKELDNNCQKHINIMLAQGYSDPLVSASQLQEFADEMSNINWTCIFYGNTKHSFTDHNVGSLDPQKEAEIGRDYNPLAAQDCFKQAMMFFEQHLC